MAWSRRPAARVHGATFVLLCSVICGLVDVLMAQAVVDKCTATTTTFRTLPAFKSAQERCEQGSDDSAKYVCDQSTQTTYKVR